MMDRNYLIHDVEKKVFSIKRKNQKLEKEKFVLNYNITKLRQQVEPREEKMEQMKKSITEKNDLLFIISEDKKKLESTIEKMKNELEAQKELYNKKHRQNRDLHIYLGRMMSDLSNAILYIQEPAIFKKAIQNIYKSYCKQNDVDNSLNEISPEVINEHNSHMSVLKKRIIGLRKEGRETAQMIKDEYAPLLQANNEIISQINKLREIKGLSNKYTVKRKTVLMKNKREQEKLKQKGAIKTIATLKAQIKDENTDNINLNPINPINNTSLQQQLIKTT
eukprot:jgi/Orpsp1_1/1176247/evm.model.c7180000056939.1